MDHIRNRKVNLKKKVDPDSIEEMQTHLNNLRESIESSRLIVQHMKDNPGWLLIRKALVEELQHIEDQLLNFHEWTDKARDKFLQQRVDLYNFMNLVEKHEQNILDASESISETTAALNERKQRLRTPSV